MKLNKHFLNLSSDFLGEISFFISSLSARIAFFFYGFLTKFNMFVKGIKFGSSNKFHGFTRLSRMPNSRIIMGKKCIFLSLPFSNKIGINRPCMLSTLDNNAEIIIGDNCGFSGTVIGAFISVKIEDNVKCGANTLITDSDWHLDDYRSSPSEPVVIKKNVWLGEGVKVLKGVVIGENSLIGANSLVVKSIPDNVIAAGNPCKVIRKL